MRIYRLLKYTELLTVQLYKYKQKNKTKGWDFMQNLLVEIFYDADNYCIAFEEHCRNHVYHQAILSIL